MHRTLPARQFSSTEYSTSMSQKTMPRGPYGPPLSSLAELPPSPPTPPFPTPAGRERVANANLAPPSSPTVAVVSVVSKLVRTCKAKIVSREKTHWLLPLAQPNYVLPALGVLSGRAYLNIFSRFSKNLHQNFVNNFHSGFYIEF